MSSFREIIAKRVALDGSVSSDTGRSILSAADGAAVRTVIDAAATANPTFTGVVTVAAGSAAAPAVVSGTGTVDTGLFFSGVDAVSMSTAGNERLRVWPDGSISIGKHESSWSSILSSLLINSDRDCQGGLPANSLSLSGEFRNVDQSTVSLDIAPRFKTGTDPTFGMYQYVGCGHSLVLDAVKINNYKGFWSQAPSLTNGSSVLQAIQFQADNFTASSSNIAYASYVSSAASNYAIYAVGTAKSWFNGNVGIGASRSSPSSELDVNGVITVSAGTGSAGLYLPSVVFTGDPNTGIQQIGGSDTFSIVTGGHERLQIGSNGNIGITTSSTTTSKFAIGGNISGTGANFIILAAGTAQSAVTQLWAYYTSPGVASNCSLTNLVHYGAQQGTISGTVTSQIGFYAVSTLTSGTNNFGFRGDLTSGTGRWNFYAHGNAHNYFAGNVGIGSGRTSPTSALDINGVITVSAGSAGAPALTFTDDTDTGVYRAGANSLAFGTNGTERIRIGPDGDVGIGIAGSSTIGLRIRHDTDANNIVGSVLNVQMPASALTSYGYWTAPSFLAENNAYTTHIHYIANPTTPLPSGSSLTGIEAGFQFGNTIQPHAVRAFVSYLNSATGYERYAFIAAGSAPSLFNGVVYFAGGTAAVPSIAISTDINTGLFAPSADNLAITTGGTERMRIKSNGVVRFIPLSADPASAEEGDMYFNSTSKKLKVYDGTSWVDLH